MSLKVLLADDSAAIKKVVQLSLQDFGITLKSVGTGKDVLEVARTFQPDVAFVDVLLPQKNGYDVAAELKSDPELKRIPVIMLWSSFMSFDEKKFIASGADDKLEKPFEVSGLRALINKYVPRTQQSELGKHLEFPKIEFGSSKTQGSASSASTGVTGSLANQFLTPAGLTPEPPKPQVVEEAKQNWSMDSFDDISKFASESSPSADNLPSFESSTQHSTLGGQTGQGPTATQAPEMWSGDNEWVRKDLSKFKVPLPDEQNDEPAPFEYSPEQINPQNFLFKPTGAAPAQAAPPEDLFITPIPQKPPSNSEQIHSALTDEMRSQAKAMIEKVIWKVVPEIATNMIKEEIQRLLGDQK